MKKNFLILILSVWLVLLSISPIKAQEDIPLFTTDFPPQEFAERRSKIFAQLGENGVAILQGAPSPPGLRALSPVKRILLFVGH
jgi:hypothetical protein